MAKGYAGNGSNIWIPEIPGGMQRWVKTGTGEGGTSAPNIPDDYNPYTDPDYENRDKQFLDEYFSSVEDDQDLLALLPDLSYEKYGDSVSNKYWAQVITENDPDNWYNLSGPTSSLGFGKDSSGNFSFKVGNRTFSEGDLIVGGIGLKRQDYIINGQKDFNKFKQAVNEIVGNGNYILNRKGGDLVSVDEFDSDIKSTYFEQALNNMGAKEFYKNLPEGKTMEFNDLVKKSQGYQDYIGNMASTAREGMLSDFTDIISSTDSMFTNVIDADFANLVLQDDEEDPLGSIL